MSTTTTTPSSFYPFIIVGAGIAGLSAAKTLVSEGVSPENILILEGRDRIGGRVCTRSVSIGSNGHFFFDEGAAW